MKEIFVSGPRRRKSAHDAYLGWLVLLHQSNRSQRHSVCASVTVHWQRHTCRRYNIVVWGGDTSQTTKSGGEERASARTFPAASKPSINIRTSWSLLQRTSDEREVKREEKERPISASGGRGRGREGRAREEAKVYFEAREAFESEAAPRQPPVTRSPDRRPHHRLVSASSVPPPPPCLAPLPRASAKTRRWLNPPASL